MPVPLWNWPRRNAGQRDRPSGRAGIGQRLRSHYARPRRITRQRCRLQIPITGQNPLGHLIDAEAWNGVLCASRDRANRQGKRQEPAQHRGTQTLRQST